MKINLRPVIAFCLLFLAQNCLAQNARFTTQGVIEYEKRVNMYALVTEHIKKDQGKMYNTKVQEEYHKTHPQFKSMKSTLTFSNGQTLYTPIAEGAINYDSFDFVFAHQNNIIATNTIAATSIAQKKVFEDTYLLKDSTRQINWKITSEIRDIAGYNCRRANAIIMDSVYVVAFYTDEIPVSGGPESFTGLPGMILGVALPYEHITWFATSVTNAPITDEKQLKAPVKGKPVDSKQFNAFLKEMAKGWGVWGQESLKALLL